MIWYGPFYCVRSYYLKAKEPKLSYIDSCCAISPFCHYSFRIVIGSRNVRSYINSKGVNPKHSLGNSRLSKITLGKYYPRLLAYLRTYVSTFAWGLRWSVQLTHCTFGGMGLLWAVLMKLVYLPPPWAQMWTGFPYWSVFPFRRFVF